MKLRSDSNGSSPVCSTVRLDSQEKKVQVHLLPVWMATSGQRIKMESSWPCSRQKWRHGWSAILLRSIANSRVNSESRYMSALKRLPLLNKRSCLKNSRLSKFA